MPRTAHDFIPRPDGDFSAFAAQFYAALEAWWTRQGYDTEQLEPLKKAVDTWDFCQSRHVAAQAAARSAAEAKNAARAALEQIIRPLAAFVRADANTTGADRADIGLTVPDATRTPSGAPTSSPALAIEQPARLTHELRLIDETTPTRRGKPAGVVGAEVWVRVVGAGEPSPTDASDLRYLMLATRTTVRTSFTPQDIGRTAVYWVRWVNTRGEAGAWGPAASATVAA